MVDQQRSEMIKALEKMHDSRVICYFLSDRESFPPGFIPGLALNLTNEAQIRFVDQLKCIGKVEKIDLFLYTRGGEIDCVWPLINLLREYCNKLTILVPFRAHSAGTLICLGADEVIMTEMGELSPIDPTTGNQFNPVDPTNNRNRFGISVEDVAAYFELSEKRAGITGEESRAIVFKELTQHVHPLALGNVQRVYMQIRRLARRLLALHMDEGIADNKLKIEQIIKALTEEFYSHVHFINRGEAIELLGPWIRKASDEENKIMWDLFNSYANQIDLRNKFQVPEFMGDELLRDISIIGGFIESTDKSIHHITTLKIFQRPNLPNNVNIQLPPGAPIPIAPGFSRTFEIAIQKLGWTNSE